VAKARVSRLSWLAAVGGLLVLLVIGALAVIGSLERPAYYALTYPFGVVVGSTKILVPPFPPLTSVQLFDITDNPLGTHLYLLGSDAGGRDLLALTAQGVVPSLQLVAGVVVARLLVGLLAGLGMAAGWPWVRQLSRGMGRWISGFPYLMLAIIVIEALTPSSRWFAFAIGMALIGWRDIALNVAGHIEHIRAQPFAESSRGLGTGPLRFFRLHVLPFLRPALAVEVPFQASATLVLLAELGFVQVFLGGSSVLVEDRGLGSTPSYTLATSPELGQILSTARLYIERHQLYPVLVPAVAVAVIALAFELIGIALNSRTAGRLRTDIAQE
jgi:ABC-type dipeptide/oligopeptide/nickel transport system permease subunit